jgi:hypothetical protein
MVAPKLYNGGFDEIGFMYSDDIDLSYMVSQTEIRFYFHENCSHSLQKAKAQ